MSTALAPLWSISEELTALLDSVATCDAELLPELQERIDAFLGLEKAKVDQVAHVLAALDYEQRCAADEIARLQERKKAAKAAQDRLEQYVCRVIQRRGVKRLEGNTNTLSVRASDAVKIVDEAKVPPKYVKESVTMPHCSWGRVLEVLVNHTPALFMELNDAPCDTSLDKAAIKKALKAGEEVPGADLEWRDNLQRR